MKKGGYLFDVVMEAYGVKVCELVGAFFQKKISEICNEYKLGLYRDDGLSIFRNKISIQLEKIKKSKLEITAESNEKMVSYQEITLNLKKWHSQTLL